MAYQHMFGSASSGSSGAGYRTLAASPDFYNVMSDDELSSFNNYSFGRGEDHPVKFCHFYKEYKQCFIQSAISFEYDYVGRNSSFAHTLVLSEQESRRVLNEHICPLDPNMFVNGLTNDFSRPESDKLPNKEYRFLPCDGKEKNSAFLGKVFGREQLESFVTALILSASNGYSVYAALPGSPRSASYCAVKIMNILTPAFPSEYRKKLGYMTYVTDTNAYEDISIYFVSGIDLSKQYISGAYCFDLRGGKAQTGIGAEDIREYRGLADTIIRNAIAYDKASFNELCDAVMPTLDPALRYDPASVNEIYAMWRFLGSDSYDSIDDDYACKVVSSFYSFSGAVDDKEKFLEKINGFWQHETEKCKKPGYCPDIRLFEVVCDNYPSFGTEEKLRTQTIWASMLLHLLSRGDSSLFDLIYSGSHDSSGLPGDIAENMIYRYTDLIIRNGDKGNTKVFRAFTERYKDAVGSGSYERLFAFLAVTVRGIDLYFERKGLDKTGERELFLTNFCDIFKDDITAAFTGTSLLSRFEVLGELKSALLPDSRQVQIALTAEAPVRPLAETVYEYFYAGSFLRSIHTDFTEAEVSRIAGDKGQISALAKCIDEHPELENIEMVALFRVFCDIVGRSCDLTVVTELDELVSKPKYQEALTKWVGIYCSAYEDIYLSLLTHTKCELASGSGIQYTVDYTAAFSDFYKGIDRSAERMMRELDHLTEAFEADVKRRGPLSGDSALFREAVLGFMNEHFFGSSIDRKTVKENEALVKKFDRLRTMREAQETGEKKRFRLFGRK